MDKWQWLWNRDWENFIQERLFNLSRYKRNFKIRGARKNKMKTKYRIGFCFYYNHELCKVIEIFINEKAQILYKVSSILNKSIYYIILNQAQIDMIIEGKDNA